MSIVLLLIIPVFAKNKAIIDKDDEKPVFVSDANKRKANYIFLEAQRMKALGKVGAFFELVRHAHEIDPTNTAISYYLGYCMLTMDNNNQIKSDIGLSLMGDHFAEKPSDYYESYFYGDACTKLGHADEALEVWTKLAELNPTKPEIKFQLADAYGNKKEYDKAFALYDSIEESQGASIPLTLRKIRLHIANSDTVGAINEGRKLLATAPKNPDYIILLGNIFLQFQESDSALVYYDKAQSVDPSNGYAYLAKANLYNQKGDSTNYENQIYKALVNKEITVEDKVNVLTDFIRQQLQEKDSTERVNNLFNVLIEQHPHEITIHDLYSQYLVARKDYSHAAEQLGYVLDLDPTNAENWKKLMFVNLMGDNFKGAIKAGDKALEYNPDNVALYQYIAPAYSQMKQYDKAIEVYDKAIALVDSTDVETVANLMGGKADSYYLRGDTALAFSTYDKAIDIAPGNPMLLNNYAYFLSEAGKDLNNAERMSAIAVHAQPENPTFLDTYAWVYFKKGEYKLALTYIKAAINAPDTKPNGDLLEHYGDILFMNGEPENAVANWEKALNLKPDSELLQRKVKNKTYFYK